jgi:transposase, IS5 family
MVLVKHLYCIPVWSRVVRLVEEHDALREVIGCAGTGEPDGVPSEDALLRFRRKLLVHDDLLRGCIDEVLASLKTEHPEMGEHVAIDGSALHAYANGHKTISRGGRERTPEEFSDPDASWGHQSATSTEGTGRSIYGYKLHCAVDTATDLPVAWHLSTGKGYEPRFVPSLLDEARRRGFTVDTCAMDKGYDQENTYEECEKRDCRPITPLTNSPRVKRGEHLPHECSHGTWVYGGSDYKRRAAKWRCPTGECEVSNRWIPASRLHTLIPRTTQRWKKFYSQRGSVERELGRLKHEYGLAPIRTRSLDRVRLHADLAILARLASGLSKARNPLPD